LVNSIRRELGQDCTVEIATRDENNDEIIIIMSDVLYVLQFRENLLSTTTQETTEERLQSNTTKRYNCHSGQEGNAVLTSELMNKRLRFLVKPCNVENHGSFYSIGKPSDIGHKIWHKRLGYIND